MTVAVAGKGGSGKTTIAGILARALGRARGPVVAIDGDTNPNLALTLGLPRGEMFPALTSDLLEQYTDETGKNRVRLAVPAREVVERFGVPAPDHVRLVVLGRVDHAGSGWMCRAHATVRELMRVLVAGTEGWTVVDLEAGLENLARATPRHAGALLVVLEPYFKSLETGRRIHELARELGIPRMLGVANKVRSAEEEEAIRDFAAAHGIEIADVVPNDETIAQADLAGRSPVDLAPDSPAVAAIGRLANSL